MDGMRVVSFLVIQMAHTPHLITGEFPRLSSQHPQSSFCLIFLMCIDSNNRKFNVFESGAIFHYLATVRPLALLLSMTAGLMSGTIVALRQQESLLVR
jgi:hypothetical protein